MSPLAFPCWVALLFSFAITSATTVDNGKLLTVNHINYYADTAVSRMLIADFDPTAFDETVPMTVIRTDEARLTAESIKEIISNYSATDDVFQSGFLEGRWRFWSGIETFLNLETVVFLIYDGEGQGQAEDSVQEALQELGNNLFMATGNYQPGSHIASARLVHDLPNGPYFFSPQTGEVYQAFRLYVDHQLAFTEGTLRDGAGGFKSLLATTSVS